MRVKDTITNNVIQSTTARIRGHDEVKSGVQCVAQTVAERKYRGDGITNIERACSARHKYTANMICEDAVTVDPNSIQMKTFDPCTT